MRKVSLYILETLLPSSMGVAIYLVLMVIFGHNLYSMPVAIACIIVFRLGKSNTGDIKKQILATIIGAILLLIAILFIFPSVTCVISGMRERPVCEPELLAVVTRVNVLTLLVIMGTLILFSFSWLRKQSR